MRSSKACNVSEAAVPTTPLRVSSRELATILAALRFHQDKNLQGGQGIPDPFINEIATDGGLVKAMSFQEVGELCQRLNIKEAVRGHKRARVSHLHPAIQQIHDLLYLDMDGPRQIYSDEKSWDADTIDMIAHIVAGHIRRPSQINSDKEGGAPHAKANGEST
jgi:hypothetical protein